MTHITGDYNKELEDELEDLIKLKHKLRRRVAKEQYTDLDDASDFIDRLWWFKMTKPTFMRASKELLEELRKIKAHKKESYEDVIERLIKNDRKKLR